MEIIFFHVRPKLASIRFETGRIVWISLLIIFCCTSLTFAQTKLTGAVQTEAGKPLPFVSLALLNNRDSSLVKGAISQENGHYEFVNLRPGQYRLVASAVGYASARTEPITVGTTSITLPKQSSHLSFTTILNDQILS